VARQRRKWTTTSAHVDVPGPVSGAIRHSGTRDCDRPRRLLCHPRGLSRLCIVHQASLEWCALDAVAGGHPSFLPRAPAALHPASIPASAGQCCRSSPYRRLRHHRNPTWAPRRGDNFKLTHYPRLEASLFPQMSPAFSAW